MKIHIFGASGSGVSTLGKALSEKWGIPYFDSDEYFWEDSDPPFSFKRNAAERNTLLKKDLGKFPQWILGGSVISWNDEEFTRFDLVIFLWIPPAVRLQRLREREWERHGDAIFLDPERMRQYEAFLEWAAGYDDNSVSGRTFAAHEDWIRKLSCPVLEMREDISIQERIGIITKYIDDQTGKTEQGR